MLRQRVMTINSNITNKHFVIVCLKSTQFELVLESKQKIYLRSLAMISRRGRNENLSNSFT